MFWIIEGRCNPVKPNVPPVFVVLFADEVAVELHSLFPLDDSNITEGRRQRR